MPKPSKMFANSSAGDHAKVAVAQSGRPRAEPRAHLISLERDGLAQQNRHPSGICKSQAAARPKISLLLCCAIQLVVLLAGLHELLQLFCQVAIHLLEED